MNKNGPSIEPSLHDEGISPTEEEVIYSALGSQVRREIIVFLKENDNVGFLELRKKFGLKVGSLYHQLNSMKELLWQDENKKYYLSDLGKVAHNLMIISKDHIESSNVTLKPTQEEKGSKTFFEKLYTGIIFIFLPRKIFRFLASEPLRTFFEGLIVIGALIFFSIDSLTVLVGFYPLGVEFWYYSLIGILGLWIFLGLIIPLFSTLFYKKKYNPLKLLATTPFVLIPSLLVIFFIWLQTKVAAEFLFLDGQILAILGQIWSLALMTTAVSNTEELTLSRSSMIVLFVFYLTYAVSFIFIGIQ
ncbi:MAG: hypothetical protein ACTSP7_12315 [Candidatus Heimdallarchaeota archaeon]